MGKRPVPILGEKFAPKNLPYERKKYLLSQGERAFYATLLQAASSQQLIVFSKVRLADLVLIPKVRNRRAHLNKVAYKHVDFVLCDPTYISPRLVVELDDKSHEAEDRKERDHFVDAVLHTAQLPILRVKAAHRYDPIDLTLQIKKALLGPNTPAASSTFSPNPPK